MKYFLWIDRKQDGPFEPAEIREMLAKGEITADTLAHPEGGDITEWYPIGDPPLFQRLKPLEPTPDPPPPAPEQNPAVENTAQQLLANKILLPTIVESGVAVVLSAIAGLELILSPIAGFVIGSESTPVGWEVFICGFTGGLILLGFARVIDHSYESAQRLHRIEWLISKALDDKNSPAVAKAQMSALEALLVKASADKKST